MSHIYERLIRRQRLIGVSLLGFGLLLLMLNLVQAMEGPLLPDPRSHSFAIDFRDYWIAAGRMNHGNSPYASEMLLGPLSSQGLDRYRYPPVFAFLLIPLSNLPYQLAGLIFDAISLIALLAGLALSLRAVNRLSMKAMIWMAVGVVWFPPTIDFLLKGNVEGLQVLLIGLILWAGAEVRGTAAIAAQAWLKIAPILILPAALARGGRRSLVGLLVGSAILVVPAFLVAPAGWWELPRILINISVGNGSESVVNLAPASWFSTLSIWATVARIITLTATVGLVGMSIWIARRPSGWPAAVACGVIASLLFPSVIWFHYLVILLPFIVMAWSQLRSNEQRLLTALLVALVAAMNLLPATGYNTQILVFTFLGMALAMGVCLRTLWPRHDVTFMAKRQSPAMSALSEK